MKIDSLLLRQIHPNFFPSGQLSSQAFLPFPKDEGRLSVYDGKLISPAQSFEHYTQKLSLQSSGVWGVSNVEIIETGLTSEPDPLPDSPAHALINFSNVPNNQWRRLAKILRRFAVTRGCLYSPK